MSCILLDGTLPQELGELLIIDNGINSADIAVITPERAAPHNGIGRVEARKAGHINPCLSIVIARLLIALMRTAKCRKEFWTRFRVQIPSIVPIAGQFSTKLNQ